MAKRCILNVAVGGWYPRGQNRLKESLQEQGYTGATLMWRDKYPDGSPPHEVLPYGFKSYALQAAVAAGYSSLLWLDASCWAINPVEPLFEEIEKAGHVFSVERDTLGQWFKDSALRTMNLTRDQAMAMPLLGGMCMGLSMAHERSRKFLERFCAICQDGTTLPGSLRNVNNCHSHDPRCLGHSHDQSVATALAHELGMALTPQPKWRALFGDQAPDTIIVAQGM